MEKITWRVYGVEGHRQRHSFQEPYSFTDWSGVSYEVRTSAVTGTNMYTEVVTIAETIAECAHAIDAQVSDGIFENDNVGNVLMLTEDGKEVYYNDICVSL